MILEKKSIQKLGRKKGKKKEKNLIAAKSWLVGMKGYQDIQPYDIFFAVLKTFLARRLFTPNLRDGFQVLKPKSRDLLPQNLVQTYN